jgi:hypothetical protein
VIGAPISRHWKQTIIRNLSCQSRSEREADRRHGADESLESLIHFVRHRRPDAELESLIHFVRGRVQSIDRRQLPALAARALVLPRPYIGAS